MKNYSLLGTLTLALIATTGWAHQITGTDVATLTQLLVDHRIVSGIYEIQYGELAALEERKQMDADGDDRITASEQAAYVERMRQQLNPNLSLEIDGEPLPVQLGEAEILPDEPLVAPVQMTLRYQLISEPSDFAERHTLIFRDANQLPRLVHADISVEGAALIDIEGVEPREGALKQVRVQSPEGPVQAAVALKPSEALWQAGPFAGGQTQLGDTEEQPASSTDRLQDMLRAEELSAGLILFALVMSLFLGAAHALEPGHGKTIVAAYLIGSRGTVANAIFLGGVVTFTHTFSVILLGVITLFASRYILPEQLFPWLGASSGLLIMGLGGWLFVRNLTGGGHGHGPGGHSHVPGDEGSHDHSDDHGDSHSHDREDAPAPRFRVAGPKQQAGLTTGGGHDHGDHDHPHDHSHDGDDAHDHAHEEGSDHSHDHAHDDSDSHDHDEDGDHDHSDESALVHSHGGKSHSHVPPGKVTLGSLLALGISGGIVPCPGALVILLLAVALHRIVFGLTLIVSFSLGLAAVLIAIGILMVKARPMMERFSGDGKLIKRLPMFSALIIILVGFVMAVRSLMEAGIVIINL
jgi:nickel/cobalt transporter (NicO) family protein